MDTVIVFSALEPVIGGAINIRIARKLYFNGLFITEQIWGGSLQPNTDLTKPLPCMFGDDPTIVPVSFDDYPAEKAFILAKWAQVEG